MSKLNPDIPHQDLTYQIIGCAMRVHNRIGPGLRERMYQRALTRKCKRLDYTSKRNIASMYLMVMFGLALRFQTIGLKIKL